MANRLPALRRRQNLTQAALAAKSGVSRNTIAKYETGKIGISAENLAKLCKVLKCRMEDVLREGR